MALRPYAKRSALTLGAGEHRQQPAGENRSDEQHRQEEQPTAQEDGGEQAILDAAELIADDADEPQEGNACKRNQVQAQPDEATSLRICLERLQRVLRQRNADHRQGYQKQHTEHDPRDGC